MNRTMMQELNGLHTLGENSTGTETGGSFTADHGIQAGSLVADVVGNLFSLRSDRELAKLTAQEAKANTELAQAQLALAQATGTADVQRAQNELNRIKQEANSIVSKMNQIVPSTGKSLSPLAIGLGVGGAVLGTVVLVKVLK